MGRRRQSFLTPSDRLERFATRSTEWRMAEFGLAAAKALVRGNLGEVSRYLGCVAELSATLPTDAPIDDEVRLGVRDVVRELHARVHRVAAGSGTTGLGLPFA